MNRARATSLLVVTVLLLLTGGLGAHPATAASGPTLYVSDPDAGVPVRVPIPADDGGDTGVSLDVETNGEVDDATYTTSVDGITVDQPSGPVGPVTPDEPTGLDLGLRGVTPGIHALTVTVRAPDARPSSTTVPFLWVPGDQAVTASDSLAGRAYELTYATSSDACTGCSVERTRVYWFVGRDEVHVGDAEHGRPSCRPVTPQCVRYHYDASTGLVQLGNDELGRLTDHESVFVSPRYVDPVLHPTDTYDYQRLTTVRRRVLTGQWRYDDPRSTPHTTPHYRVELTLRQGGTYRLRDTVAPGLPHDWREITGRYRLEHHDTLRLLTEHRTTALHRRWPRTMTLLAPAYNSGRAEGPDVVIWLGEHHPAVPGYSDQDERGGYVLVDRRS